MLDAIEQDGLGNWYVEQGIVWKCLIDIFIRQDAASHVLTKSTDEVKEYYTETYINGIIGEGTCVCCRALYELLFYRHYSKRFSSEISGSLWWRKWVKPVLNEVVYNTLQKCQPLHHSLQSN